MFLIIPISKYFKLLKDEINKTVNHFLTLGIYIQLLLVKLV